MVLATAIAPPLTLAPTPSPDADIQRAAELWEQANNLLLDAGRIFAETKAGAKRKFNQLIESANLEKTQVRKLVKAIEAADEIPSSVAARLGLPMLVQLGQHRSEPVRDAIAPDDTQATVAQKMKELKKPAAPKEVKPIRFIGGQKGGVGKLRIEVPGCTEAVELERDWFESGLPPLQWLQGRTVNAQNSPPPTNEEATTQAEQATVQSELEGKQLNTIADAPSMDDEVVASALSPNATEIPAREEVEIFTLTLNPPILPTDHYLQGWNVGEYAVPNTTYGYLPMSFRLWCLGQPVRIEAVVGSTGSVQTLTVTRHDGETDRAMSNWLEETTAPPLTLFTTTQPQGATPDANYTNATPTLRYQQGWNVGDMAVANRIGGEHFVNWCALKPIRIEQATGGVGEIEILTVSPNDGQTDMSFGNWIEDVPDSIGESASATTPDFQSDKETALYKVIQTDDCWSDEVVKIVKPGDTYHQVSLQSGGKAWTEVKNECLIPLSNEAIADAWKQEKTEPSCLDVMDSDAGVPANADARRLANASLTLSLKGGVIRVPFFPEFLDAEQNSTLIAERIVREYGLAVGDVVEWRASDSVSAFLGSEVQASALQISADGILTGKIARLTEFGAFIDETYLGKNGQASYLKCSVPSINGAVLRGAHFLEDHSDEGCPGYTWIKYKYLRKIDSKVIASEKRTTEKPTIEPSQQEPESETPDYSQLSESLKKAKNWERVTELVERDATTLTAAMRDWSAEQKSVLINHIVNYLEKNKRAILCHELDWIPIQSLKKVFFKLSFKVHDISEGLASPWHNGCIYVNVANFGNDDDEVWTFVNANGSQIKAWSRDDFEVVAF